jgi:hypothetical protein
LLLQLLLVLQDCTPKSPSHSCRLGNAFTLWLGIDPPDLFFYAFLPPLLLHSALSIDYFLFNKAREGAGGHSKQFVWPALLHPALPFALACPF